MAKEDTKEKKSDAAEPAALSTESSKPKDESAIIARLQADLEEYKRAFAEMNEKCIKSSAEKEHVYGAAKKAAAEFDRQLAQMQALLGSTVENTISVLRAHNVGVSAALEKELRKLAAPKIG
jgi:hypothetical protein